VTISLPRPDDWHVHLRQGDALASYARTHSAAFGRILAMPNTTPPLVSPEDVLQYGKSAEEAAPGLEVLTAFRLMPRCSEEDVRALAAAGVPAGKYYPDGATTNSAGGLSDWRQIDGALAAMEETGLVLCLHGEAPSAPVLDREEAFLPVFREIRQAFPRLKMILEHVSSSAGVRIISESDGLTAATVTVQHLLFTLDDLLGGLLNPHLFCKPVVKFDEDRRAIRDRVLAGDSRFFFGSDSAPHLRESKESDCCPAGAYTAPMALPALVTWFEEEDALDCVEPFFCEFGRKFYNVPGNAGRIELERKPWTVPSISQGCVPLMAGEILPWRLVE
jgi:dihydroorotase